jgi:hypothetical protein
MLDDQRIHQRAYVFVQNKVPKVLDPQTQSRIGSIGKMFIFKPAGIQNTFARTRQYLYQTQAGSTLTLIKRLI